MKKGSVLLMFQVVLAMAGCDPRSVATISADAGTGVSDAAVCRLSATTTSYDVVRFGAVADGPADTQLIPWAINNSDAVAGVAVLDGFRHKAFIALTPSTPRFVDNTMRPPEDLKNFHSNSEAYSINNDNFAGGSIVFHDTGLATIMRGALFLPTGTLPRASFETYGRERVYDVNDFGVSVGVSGDSLSSTVPPGVPVLWRGSTAAALPTAPGQERGSKANTINNHGLIGGISGHRPYLWREGVAEDLSERMPPGRNWCEVVDINERDVALINCREPGAAGDVIGNVIASYQYDVTTRTIAEVGAPEPLRYFRATAINNDGCVVGSTNTSEGFIQCGTSLRYLSDLLPAGWTQVFPSDINDRGAITAAFATDPSGARVGVLLTPRCGAR